MSIGQVVEKISAEFPALKQSRIRLWEEYGLISPYRTASGYRRYSQADVERIRFICSARRDSYASIPQIAQNLKELDAGVEISGPIPAARIVASDGELRVPNRQGFVTNRDILDFTGISLEDLNELVRVGLISADVAGRYPAGAVEVVRNAMILMEQGIEARNLRPIRSAAFACGDLISRMTSGEKARRGSDRERVRAKANNLGEIMSKMVTELIRIESDKV